MPAESRDLTGEFAAVTDASVGIDGASVTLLVREARVRRMRPASGGDIVIINSVAGLPGRGNEPGYAARQWNLHSITVGCDRR
jgi:NAD(P)-dependent dehydrogenase (short-subunit alcohol dehydrogenase family)